MESKCRHPISRAYFEETFSKVKILFLKQIQKLCQFHHTLFGENTFVRLRLESTNRTKVPVYKHKGVVLIHCISPLFRRYLYIFFRNIGNQKRIRNSLKLFFQWSYCKGSSKHRPEIYTNFFICRIKEQQSECMISFPGSQELYLLFL